jgi:hypothetical protein
MRAVLASLARRRAALIERSAMQRAEIVAAVGGVRRSAAEPLVLALGTTLALAGAAPRLRLWFVRAWVIGALVRRLLR